MTCSGGFTYCKVLYTFVIVPNHDDLVNIPFVMTYMSVRMTDRRVERIESKSENSYLEGTRTTCTRGSQIYQGYETTGRLH